ncbi:MAG: ArsR family transcriptional regulator [Microgenomates group bacterium GW2011_GWA1_46_7]|nr:MAG: ArsR family transcriptional regulator [Microgenomates group bacterium GW2011_GWA1_46_7]
MTSRIFIKQANLVKALSHPSRLELIHLLRSRALTVSQMAKMLGKRQAYVSQHLLILKRAKVTASTRHGKEIYYEVADPHISTVCDSLFSLVHPTPLSASPEPIVVDPVCKMKLTPSRASYTGQYNGVRYYFCGRGCIRQFKSQHGVLV